MKAIENNGRIFKNVQILVPLKFISSFFRSLELPLINTKLNLELFWKKNCLLINVSRDNNTLFQIIKTELYVPVVTLKTKDYEVLNNLISSGVTKPVFWNEYKSTIETHVSDATNLKRILLDSSFQGANRLFVLANINDGVLNAIDMDSRRKYALPREKLTKFNVLIDGRNVYDQPISSDITKYEELLKLAIGKGEDYETGCLLDYDYYKKHYSIIACDLSRQKELGPDPRSAQQLEIMFMLDTNSQILTILEKSKETKLGTTKIL